MPSDFPPSSDDLTSTSACSPVHIHIPKSSLPADTPALLSHQSFNVYYQPFPFASRHVVHIHSSHLYLFLSPCFWFCASCVLTSCLHRPCGFVWTASVVPDCKPVNLNIGLVKFFFLDFWFAFLPGSWCYNSAIDKNVSSLPLHICMMPRYQLSINQTRKKIILISVLACFLLFSWTYIPQKPHYKQILYVQDHCWAHSLTWPFLLDKSPLSRLKICDWNRASWLNCAYLITRFRAW